MGMNDFEREYKVAISMYPFLEEKKQNENLECYLELNRKAIRDKEAIVYIHIPFCDSICDFCIYNRIKSEVDIMQEYSNALVREIKMYAKTDYIKTTKISAIYIGGGTPTSLGKEQLSLILEVCRKEFNISEDTEVTVEVNPINVDEDMLSVLKRLAVNRISAGVQTFNDDYRRNIGVKLKKKDILEWIEIVSKYSFDTVAIDLMYALPNQTVEKWISDIELAISLPINHLSIYELDIFSNTRLGKRVAKGEVLTCSGKEKYQMFLKAQDILKRSGFVNQIIPEFYKSKHMCKYWDSAFDAWTDTIALGVSAFGFVNRCSYQNEDSIKKYICKVHNNEFPIKYVSERATEDVMAERELIFSLRKGAISKREFGKKKELRFFNEYMKKIRTHIEKGLIVEEDECYALSTKGRYFQEDVAVEYMCSTFENRTSLYRKLVLGTRQIV